MCRVHPVFVCQDMEAVVWLETYLSKFNKILLLVSHSEDFLNGVCTNILHMTGKKLVEYGGNYDTVRPASAAAHDGRSLSCRVCCSIAARVLRWRRPK